MKWGRYQARIMFGQKAIHLGTFDTAEEAALARDQKAKDLFGNRAILNFPEDEAA